MLDSINKTFLLHKDAWNLYKVLSFHLDPYIMCKGLIMWIKIVICMSSHAYFLFTYIIRPCVQFPFYKSEFLFWVVNWSKMSTTKRKKWWFKMSSIPFLVIFAAIWPEKSDFDRYEGFEKTPKFGRFCFKKRNWKI